MANPLVTALTGIITWAGTSSDSFKNSTTNERYVYIKKEPNFSIPKRKADVYNIPGRNGDIIVHQDAWENLQKKYTLFLKPNLSSRSLFSLSRQIARWLCAPTGYNVLQDNYETDYFYLAYLINEVNIENHLNRFGTVDLTFSCRPEKFLVEGTEEVAPIASRHLIGNPSSTQSTASIENPTGFDSKPLIRLKQINGEGSAQLTINDTVVKITEMTPSGSDGLIIDCDTMNAYSGTAINRNNRVIIENDDAFPVLKSGQNTISVIGDVDTVYITPRWWII